MYDWPKNVAHPRIFYPRLAKTRHKHKMDKTRHVSRRGGKSICSLSFILCLFVILKTYY